MAYEKAGEIWRMIPSLPEYMASSEGRVMRTPYVATISRGDGQRHYGGQPHFGVWNKRDGRFVISFRGTTYKVHRLICEAFHGPPPFGEAVCMHVDENAANNRPSNLQWGSQRENLNAPGFIEYCKGRTGENSPYAKSLKRKAEAADRS